MSKSQASSTSTSLTFYTTVVPSILDDLDSTDEVIDDTDRRVLYNGSWIQNLNDGGVPSKTSHSTLVAGSTITLDFNGTGIDVLGTAALGSQVIQAVYKLDNSHDHLQETSVSGTQFAIACQTFYSVRDLQYGTHRLLITVTSGVNPREFIVDSFVVTGASSSGATSGPSTAALAAIPTTPIPTTPIPATITSNSSTSTSTGPSLSDSSTASASSLSSGVSASSFISTATPSTQSSSANSRTSVSGVRSLSAGQIAGVAVGSFASLLLLIALILTICRWRSIRKRQNPKPDTTPRPLFTKRPISSFSLELGGEKHRSDFKLLQPPKYYKKSTSPGPPSDGTGAWMDTFGHDI